MVIRKLIGTVRNLKSNTNVPELLSGEPLKTTVNILNGDPSKSISKQLFEPWTGGRPNFFIGVVLLFISSNSKKNVKCYANFFFFI